MKKVTACIESQEELLSGIYSMWLSFPDEKEVAEEAVPGQFLSIYSTKESCLLPRPISICEIDRNGGRIRIVYRVVGKGTYDFSLMRAGACIDVMGPLGNGFPLSDKKILVVGGGIGIPPLLQLAKESKGEVNAVLGYRDKLFLQEEFEKACSKVWIATEDGSAGIQGNVMDAIRSEKVEADVIYACGPKPMLRGIKEYAGQINIPAWISMEEHMACGVGACLACVCESKDVDEHSHVHNKRICKDGPVFAAEEIAEL